MATYDLTDGSVSFVGAGKIAALPTSYDTEAVRMVSAIFDLGALIKNGYTLNSGDVFQLLEIQAGTLVLVAGATVESAFDGTTTVNVDFAGGDDIVDGADVTSTGVCAAGTNGTDAGAFLASGSKNYADDIATTDTIDVTLTSSDATTGVLRVWAIVADYTVRKPVVVPTDVDRDQLA